MAVIDFRELTEIARTSVITPIPTKVYPMADAISEYIMLHRDECQQNYTARNQIFLGAIGPPEYVQPCITPIRSNADIKRKKMRSSMDAIGRWAESLGGTKVSLPANDIYEAWSGSSGAECRKPL